MYFRQNHLQLIAGNPYVDHEIVATDSPISNFVRIVDTRILDYQQMTIVNVPMTQNNVTI